MKYATDRRQHMDIRRILIVHSLIALIAAGVLYVCTAPLLAVPKAVAATDAAIHGCTLSLLLFLLKNVVRYTHISSLLFRQRSISYTALGLLFAACWTGSGYIILCMVFPAGGWGLLLPVIPVRVVIAALVYSVAVIVFSGSETTGEDLSDTGEYGYGSGDDESQQATDEGEATRPAEIIERITVKNRQKIDVIMVSEIICVLAEGDYVVIHTEKGKYLKEQTMKSLESALPPGRFVRVHRSGIVNVSAIVSIELYNKQTQLLKLRNGIQVKASAAGYRALKNSLGL